MPPRPLHAYDATLAQIYASYLARKPLLAGRPDRDTRDPALCLGVARAAGLIPPPARILKVTGSKGKGTTARMIAEILRQTTGLRVGLFTSPEELTHCDRMRVNGESPSPVAFTEAYQRHAPALARLEAELEGLRYLSPFGIFLILALDWFRLKEADLVVLEGGRGAAHDEVGQIESAVSVVTSILPEHLAQLGPTLADVAADKLHAGRTAQALICPPEVAAWNDRLGIVPPERVHICHAPPLPDAMPAPFPLWHQHNAALARHAARTFLAQRIESVDLAAQSPSFGQITQDGLTIFYDGCISATSLDRDHLRRVITAHDPLILTSLPDDKDGAAIVHVLTTELGGTVAELALTGARGVLSYTRARDGGRLVASLPYDNPVALRDTAARLAAEHGTQTLYFLGTQTFLRLVKSAYLVPRWLL